MGQGVTSPPPSRSAVRHSQQVAPLHREVTRNCPAYHRYPSRSRRGPGKRTVVVTWTALVMNCFNQIGAMEAHF